MKIHFYCLFLFIILFLSSGLYSQQKNILFKKLHTENGLSANLTQDIIQDEKGYIWIATPDGLDRFDGVRIRHYKHDPEDSTSIFSNRVRNLILDKNGRLWIGFDGGLSRYLPKYDCFKNFHYKLKNTSAQKSQTSLYLDKKNNLWFIQGPQVYIFKTNSDTILHSIDTRHDLGLKHTANIISCFDQQNNLWVINDETVYCLNYNQDSMYVVRKITGNYNHDIPFRPYPTVIYEDSDHNIYIANHGLFRVQKNIEDSLVFEYINIFPKKRPDDDLDFQIGSITEDEEGYLWISTKNYGLIVYHPETKNIRRYTKKNNFETNDILKTEIDKNGVTWVFTKEKKLYAYQKEQDNFKQFVHDEANIYSISEFDVRGRQILTDKSGVYWFNTLVSGINYFNLNKSWFECYRYSRYDKNGLMSNILWAIYEDSQGRVWIGAEGINVYDPEKEKFLHFSEKFNPELKYISSRTQAIIEIKPDQYFIEASGRIIWCRYEVGELQIIRNFAPEKNNPNSLVDWSPFYFLKDHKGKIWIGTIRGLSCYQLPDKNNPDGQFKNYIHQKDDPNSLPNDHIWHLTEDSKKRIWICTNTNVAVMNRERTNITAIHPVIDQDTIKVLSPRCILEFPQNIYWISCEGYGLIKYDEIKKSFERFSMEQGLPTNNIISVLNDDFGDLWLSTNNKGLIRFNPNNASFEVFTKSDGLQGNEFFAGSFHKGKTTGKLYFGGSNGVNAFDPGEIQSSNFKPSIVFTSFRLFDKEIKPRYGDNQKNALLTQAINYLDKLVLKYDQNIFTIEFAALHYSAPKKIIYKYKLEGLDKDWKTVDYREAKAGYTGLPPGEYVLRVKSSNCDGLWFDNERRIAIIILPPWWLSKWGYMAYFVLFICGMLLLRRLLLIKVKYEKKVEIERLKFEQQKALLEKENELEQIKTQFFMNISHEFRTPLSLILGPVENMLHAVDLPSKFRQQHFLILRNAKRLLRLINQLLDLRKLESGKMNLSISKGNIVEFLETIYKSFEYLADRKHIDYQFDTANVKTQPYNSVTRPAYYDIDKLEKILYNLISNAFKYTPEGGRITIRIELLPTPDGEDHSGTLRIMISDTGVGIAPEKIPYIFDRFYRIEGNSQQKLSGTGIGLALTKELVELHQGKINVESLAGSGSIFTVEIPVNKDAFNLEVFKDETDNYLTQYPHITNKTEDTHEPEPDTETDLSVTTTEKPVLLIIDDNPDVRIFIRSETNNQFKIIEAGNGKEGLDLAIQYIPDIIICDIMMPVMDGIEFSKNAHKDERLNHIPLIFLTARSSEHQQLEGLKTGAFDYIIKPFSIEVLKNKLQNIFNSRQRLIKKFESSPHANYTSLSKNQTESRFLEKAVNIVVKNIDNANFSADELCREMGMSKSQLYRKLKAVTNQSINIFIRTVRIKEAANLLKRNKKNVTEIAYMVGFNDRGYFSKSFKKHFGVLPSEYPESLNK